MSKKYDLSDYIGKNINKLTILKEAKNDKKGTYALCRCECGNEKEIQLYNVLKGNSKTCGNCTYKGLYNTRLARIYTLMISRCTNVISKNYKDYGERGIRVCDDWLNDFSNFYDWSIENGYKEDLTIDRIDVNGNYEPNNCRWVNMTVQQNNRRNNVSVTYKGETKTLTEWSRTLGINYNTLRGRLFRNKWSIEKSFETPIKK